MHFLPELHRISLNIFVPVMVWRPECEKQKCPECGECVWCERQEQLSQLYEHHMVWKARMIVYDKSHVLAKHYELLPSGRQFRVQKSNTVSSISEQINPFKHQSRETPNSMWLLIHAFEIIVPFCLCLPAHVQILFRYFLICWSICNQT